MSQRIIPIIMTFSCVLHGAFMNLHACDAGAKAQEESVTAERQRQYEEASVAASKAYEAGEFAEAIKHFLASAKHATKEQLDNVYENVAACHARLGQVEEAIVQLELRFKNGSTYFEGPEGNQDLRSVIEHPKYKELVAKYKKIAEENEKMAQERDKKTEALFACLEAAEAEYEAKNYEVATKQYLAIIEKSDPTEHKDEIQSAHFSAACCYALLGKADDAIKQLEQCFNSGWSNFEILSKEKNLDSIRNNPKFKKLIAKFSKKP